MRAYLAEFICTYALVLIGTGAIIANQLSDGAVGLIGISLAFGFIIAGMVYTFGSTSGAHMNPAVSAAFLALGDLSLTDFVGYVVAQCIGAVAASFTLLLLFPDGGGLLGATLPSDGALQSFVIEVLTTYLLMLSILGIIADEANNAIAGLVIGLVVVGLIMFAGPISGASFNPARSLGPALVSGHLTSLWLYLVAPTLGAVSAASSWMYLKPAAAVKQ